MNKHTPRPSDVMAYFDLSDEQWDILPNSVVDRLTEIYMKETAAPAMYDALRELTNAFALVVKMTPYGVSMDVSKVHDNARAALAQAEGSKP